MKQCLIHDSFLNFVFILPNNFCAKLVIRTIILNPNKKKKDGCYKWYYTKKIK